MRKIIFTVPVVGAVSVLRCAHVDTALHCPLTAAMPPYMTQMTCRRHGHRAAPPFPTVNVARVPQLLLSTETGDNGVDRLSPIQAQR